jgi:hypothetical protein
MAKDLKLKPDNTFRILESLENKGYISIEQYGMLLRITHSLKDLKLPKEEC